MAEFKKASALVGKLKVALYGEAGTGKTYTSLLIGTKLGKVAVIDSEHGTDMYASEFDFDVLHTRSLQEALEALQPENIKQYDVIIIDSITHFWEDAQESYLKTLEQSKDPRAQKRAENGDITFGDWRFIKKPYKKLIGMLLQMDKHVFITGRISVMYTLKNGDLIVTGTRMKAEGDTQYEPHILLRMERRGKDVVAVVEKDRSNSLPAEIINPTIEAFKPVIKKLGMNHDYFKNDSGESVELFKQELKEAKVIEIEQTPSKQNTDIKSQLVRDLPSATKNKIYKAFEQVAEDDLNRILSEFFVESIDDLTYQQARDAFKLLNVKDSK